MDEIGAVGKENVLIRAGNCALASLPHFRCKIASIRNEDQELTEKQDA
jgi:hypothetical protein